MKELNILDVKRQRELRHKEVITYTETDGEFTLALYSPVEHYMTAFDDETFIRCKDTGKCLGKSGFSYGRIFDEKTHKRLPSIIHQPNCLERFTDGKNPLDEFKKSKYWQRLFDCGEVLFIYLAGSRMINCYDEESDYDIFVITDGSFIKASEEATYENVRFRGVKLQWWFQNIHTLLPDYTAERDWLVNWGIVLLGQLSKENLLYVNPKYQKVVDFIQSEHERIEHIGLHQYYECKHEIIDYIATTREVVGPQMDKWLYSMCWTADHFSGVSTSRSFINIIKRMKYRGAPKAVYDDVADKLNVLYTYIHTDKKTFDYIKEKEIFRVNLESILKEI